MNEFIARNGIIAQNNSTITGSLTVTNGITGSISGIATSASYAISASQAASAVSSSYALTATSASFATLASTASYFLTSSVSSASFATSASYAATSSFASDFTVANTLTATTLVVNTISSSVTYSSGSNVFGNDVSNTQVFTGSVNITGSFRSIGPMTVSGSAIVTGSLTALSLIKVGGTSSQYLMADGSTSLFPDLSSSIRSEQTYTATSGQTTFTVTGGYVVGLVDVYVNGVKYAPEDYTATNGTTVVLGTGVVAGDIVDVINYKATIAALPTSRDTFDYTATAGQTSFTVSGGYVVGLLDVYVNGVKLTSSEYTASNGTTFVLTVASVVGDEVQAIRYNASVNGVSGAGTTNYIPKFTASQTIGDSAISDNGTTVTLNSRALSGSSAAFSSTVTTNGQLTMAYGGTPRLVVQDTDSGAGNVGILFKESTNDRWAIASVGGALQFFNETTSANAMYITSGSNVGIGTTSPGTLLHLVNSSGPTIRLVRTTNRFDISADNDFMEINARDASTYMIFKTADTERIRITSSGSVGIGVTPSTWNSAYTVLQIGSTGTLFQTPSNTILGQNIYVNASDNNAYLTSNYATQYRQVNGTHIWYYAASGTAGANISFSEAMRITASGNIGIGTTSPEGLVTIKGTSAQPPTSGTTANSLLQIVGSLGGELNIGSNTVLGEYGSYIQVSDNNLAVPYALNLQPNGGQVGIGTYNLASVGSALVVAQSGTPNILTIRRLDASNTGTARLFFQGTNASSSVQNIAFIEAGLESSATAAYLAFASNTTERMRITSSGAVKIGKWTYTDATFRTLYLGSRPNDATYSIINFNPYAGNYNYGFDLGVYDDGTSGNQYFWIGDNRNSERMRIDSAGAVFINTTSNPVPNNASPQLGILAGGSTDAINIKHTVNGNNSFNIWQTGTTSHNAIAFYKGDTQTNRGLITVTTSGTTYNSVSDYRLKENVTPIENGIDRLMQLKPSKFNWIETGHESEGFIAHELQEIFPDAVTGEKDAVYSSTGNIKPQSVDYGRITPLLVKALQEQQVQIQTLTARLQELENK